MSIVFMAPGSGSGSGSVSVSVSVSGSEDVSKVCE
jgi:hypothetical protein